MSKTDSKGKKTDESGRTEAQSAEIAQHEAQRMRDVLGDTISEIELEWFGECSYHFIIVKYEMEMGECSGIDEAQIINTVLGSNAAVHIDSTVNGRSELAFIPSQFAHEGHFAQAGDSQ